MKIRLLLIFTCLALTFPNQIIAALWDRGGGLIYDDVLNITWLQDANYAGTLGLGTDGIMNLRDAGNWIQDLSYHDPVRNAYWSDWRLPRVRPVNGSNYDYGLSYHGSTDIGYNISSSGSAFPGSAASEMAYMYYNNLRNTSFYPLDYPNSSAPQPGWSNTPNSGFVDGNGNEMVFENLIANWYWSETQAYNSFDVFTFRFDYGGQNHAPYHPFYFSWPVRDGDVGAVPIPGAVWLLCSGLIALAGLRKIQRGHMP